jgi:hypothetical protein
MLVFSTASYAQVTNYGYENGNYTGWTVSNGSTTLRTSWSDSGAGVQVTTGMQNYCPGGGKCWTVTPYGSYMVSVQAGGSSPNFNNAMTTLGLSSSTITSIRNTIYSNGNMYPTNASSISRSVYLQAGITYTYAWQYLSTDYVPYNDGSMITLTGGPGTATINGQTQDYALLGFTNPGTGNYSTNSYGATGWQVAVFTVPTDGNYTLGFSSFNLGDTALSPILFIDQMQGTTSLNGATFAPVAPNAGSTAPPAPAPEPTFPAATISAAHQLRMNNVRSAVAIGNSIYIDQSGNYANITVEQYSRNNALIGPDGQQYAKVYGDNNNLVVKQGDPGVVIGNNIAEVALDGPGNNVSIFQGRTNAGANSVESHGHRLTLKVTGSSNTVSVQQKNNAGTNSGHYLEATVLGSGNSMSFNQSGNSAKNIFANINSNSNTINVIQQGNAEHYLSIDAAFGAGNINVTQSGDFQKRFNLTLNNPGIGVTVSQTNATAADSAAMSITCNTGPCTGYTYVKN